MILLNYDMFHSAQSYLFLLFVSIVGIFLILDLGYFNRKSHRIEYKEALYQSLFWVGISLVFAGLIFWFIGRDPAAEFLSAYVTEKMLSVDNLFVMMLIFNYFKLEEKYYHRTLFWGILGAMIFRGVFISAGAYIIYQFHWVLYVFGLVLLYTGISLFASRENKHLNLENNRIMKAARRYLPFSTAHHDGHFFVKEKGHLVFTSLFLILLLVETTDIVFAVDSIPAVFAISQSFFIVFTSNIFAVLGLRALFFLIDHVLQRFRHLQKGLALILLFIGFKMLSSLVNIHISSVASFFVIILILVSSIILSLLTSKQHNLQAVYDSKKTL
ncbi:MAG: TerC/Alx family metal homeostasis membrane protein [Patescibacteria group bacterium]